MPRPKASPLSRAASLGILLAAALSSCSFNYGQEEGQDKLSEEQPTSVDYNFEHTVVQDSQIVFKLRAGKAEYYSAKKETRLTDVRFAEFDSSTGGIVTSGSAASAVYHDDTKNAEIFGPFSFYSGRNEARITGEYLSWDDSTKSLAGKKDGTVSVVRDDGSSVSGRGFRGDGRKRSFSFSSDVSGRFVSDPSSKASEPE